jgi:hypothetical protein
LLSCFMAPLGFPIQTSLNQQKMNLVPLVLGAIALISGIVLLAAVRRKVNKGQE